MADQFKDKVVLVTGGARGIGRAIVEGFAAEAAQVVVADVLAERIDETVAAVNAAGGHAIGAKTDVADSASVAALFELIAQRFGRLDVGVNCAAVTGPVALMADIEEADFDRCVAIDLKGVWLCMRAELRMMLPKGGGVIVNIASTAGLRGAKRATPYVASKHGVIGLTKAAALEYASKGMRVNAVCPGLTETDQTRPILANETARASMMRALPVGRPAQPSEIAPMAVWLASDAAAFANGGVFVVDGGMTVP